jgi:hypothetical protein
MNDPGSKLPGQMDINYRKGTANGVSPDEVAKRLFEGIRSKQFYILTHPESVEMVRNRMGNIIDGTNPSLSKDMLEKLGILGLHEQKDGEKCVE